jgi:hypothetical protein
LTCRSYNYSLLFLAFQSLVLSFFLLYSFLLSFYHNFPLTLYYWEALLELSLNSLYFSFFFTTGRLYLRRSSGEKHSCSYRAWKDSPSNHQCRCVCACVCCESVCVCVYECVCVCPILHPHLHLCLPHLYTPLLPLDSISSSLPFFLPSFLLTFILHSFNSLMLLLTYPTLSHSLLQTYVTLVELLERARQYRAVLALYRVMVRDGYDFYENTVLNGVFKRLGRYPFLSLCVVFLLFFLPYSIHSFSPFFFFPSSFFFLLSSFFDCFIYS